MANEFYTPSGTPVDNSEGDPGVMRGEFARIQQGFDKMPALAGNANKPVVIDPSGSRMIAGAAISYETAFPTGTKIVFAQASVPPGYTQDTTNNDCMLRLVNTAGGGIGGSHSPILMDLVPSHTHTQQGTFLSGGSTIDLSHSHPPSSGGQFALYGGVYNGTGGGTVPTAMLSGGSSSGTGTSGSAGNAHQHYTTISGLTTANGGASNWTPKFYNAIIGIKN